MSALELTIADATEPVRDWLRQHDLDPSEVTPGVVVRDGQITATLFLRNEAGDRYREPATGEVASREVTVPLRAPVPSGHGQVIP